MDAQDTVPEGPKQPAPPLQGGQLDLPWFPGLAPWAILPDPFGVVFRVRDSAPLQKACQIMYTHCQVCFEASLEAGYCLNCSSLAQEQLLPTAVWRVFCVDSRGCCKSSSWYRSRSSGAALPETEKE